MPELHQFPLVTTSGRRGRVFRTSRFLDRSERTSVTLDDGTELSVPSEAIRPQADGSFLLDEKFVDNNGTAADQDQKSVDAEKTPREPEVAEVEERPRSRNYAPPASERNTEKITATALDERSVLIDEPLYYEDVEVERVPVNRIVDGPVQTRQEGDVMIVPVVEEVVTVQKRLLLKEEVRIRRRRTEVREPRRVVVDGEEIRIFGADGRPIQT
jgi:hypothetical protein